MTSCRIAAAAALAGPADTAALAGPADAAAYFTATRRTGCYPTVSVTFTPADPARHRSC